MIKNDNEVGNDDDYDKMVALCKCRIWIGEGEVGYGTIEPTSFVTFV